MSLGQYLASPDDLTNGITRIPILDIKGRLRVAVDALTGAGPAAPTSSQSVVGALSTIFCTWQISLSANTPALLIPAWASGTAYKKGQVVQNDSGKMYRCITAGTSAGSGGPTGTASDITDNTAHWAYVSGFGLGLVVTNTDTTLAIIIYWGTDSGITTSAASAAIAPLGDRQIPAKDLSPTGIYLVAGSAVVATVAAAV